MRAAQQQLLQRRIGKLETEARKLWDLYGIGQKAADWRDYGDVALHVAGAYPPDLAYVLIYSLREIGRGTKSDPVPNIMAALEGLYFARPDRWKLHLDGVDFDREILESAEKRAERALRILVREVSAAPYRYATGIYARFHPRLKPLLIHLLAELHPAGAEILSNESRAWMRTWTGVKSLIARVLFGKE